MSDPLTIREMCVEYGVTARTLRFYEAKELLFPIRDGQRRLFTKRDQARLKLIIKGKGLVSRWKKSDNCLTYMTWVINSRHS